MSLYCSYWDIGDEHDATCKRMRRVRGWFVRDDSKRCTCGSCPIEYAGSHVLPTENDRRSGQLGISAIPDHVTDREAGFTPWKPFLRVHVNDATVVLTKAQAEKFRNALTEWLVDSASLPSEAGRAG